MRAIGFEDSEVLLDEQDDVDSPESMDFPEVGAIALFNYCSAQYFLNSILILLR